MFHPYIHRTRVLYEAVAYHPDRYDVREQRISLSDVERMRDWVRARQGEGMRVRVWRKYGKRWERVELATETTP